MFLVVKKDTLIVHGNFNTEKEALNYINNDTKKFGLVCLSDTVIDCINISKDKKCIDTVSVVSELSKEQTYYVTLISRLMNELVNERIITPSQRTDVTFYVFNKLKK